MLWNRLKVLLILTITTPLNCAIILGMRYAMTSQTTRNFHVPLPEPVYQRLRVEAQRSNRSATDVAREAIDRWLAEQQRLFVHESIAEHARDSAGSPADLDKQLESAAIESLLAIKTEVNSPPVLA